MISDLTTRRLEAARPTAPGGVRSGPAINLRKPAPPPACSPRAARFRAQIEKAEADGLARTDMTLRLTKGDADLLKRDPGLQVSDISFADGVMRFLGVKVEQGVVVESGLDTSG